VTQQNAALVEEAAAAAESMQEQAQSLTKAVAIFKLSSSESAPSPLTKHEERESNHRVGADAKPPSPSSRGEGRSEGKRSVASQGKGIEGGGQWDGKVERRGPNRAKNVARLPGLERKPAPQPKADKVANGDDNWQEF
jgi:hypothetical protein